MSTTTRDKVANFFADFPLRKISKNHVMVQAGDELPGVIFLISGQVQQYDITDGGEKVVVNIFKPPAFFPMSWAINKTPNQYFYEAASDIQCRIAPPDKTVAFIKDNPDVLFDLLSRVYSGTDGLLRRMAHLMGSSARSRLLYELQVQAKRLGLPQADGSILLKTTESDIAKQTGLARETISRELTKLRHLVTVNHSGITIKDINQLQDEI